MIKQYFFHFTAIKQQFQSLNVHKKLSAFLCLLLYLTKLKSWLAYAAILNVEIVPDNIRSESSIAVFRKSSKQEYYFCQICIYVVLVPVVVVVVIMAVKTCPIVSEGERQPTSTNLHPRSDAERVRSSVVDGLQSYRRHVDVDRNVHRAAVERT